jgi:hypothetical protein
MDEWTAAQLHRQDLAVQDRLGVRYLKYSVDPATGKVFWLSEAPSSVTLQANWRIFCQAL